MSHALVLTPFDPVHLERLAKRMRVTHQDWLKSNRIHDPEELGARMAEEAVDFLVIEADFVFEETLQAAPGLRLVAVCRNGLNHVDLEAATAHGVLVVNAPGRNAVGVAEHTLGLMLALARHIPAADRYIKEGHWQDPVSAYAEFRGTELAGKTLGIVGFGAIGRLVGQRGAALGMQVVASDPFVSAAEALGVKMVALDSLLAESDFVSIHAAATEASMGLVGRAQLERMKPTAYLINTSAAGLVEEEALVAALETGRLAGAALDVFEGQPLPGSSPLLRLRNLVLTPHIGGATEETIQRQSAMVSSDILLAVDGQRPQHLVNPAAWERWRTRSQAQH